MLEKENKEFKSAYKIAVGVCICFLAVSLIFIYSIMQENQKAATASLYNAADQNQTAILKQVEGDLQTLRGIAIWIETTYETEREYTRQLLKTINDNNHFIRMGIADHSGSIDLLDINGQVHEDVDVSKYAFFQEAMAGSETVSETIKDSFGNGYIFYYGTPLYNEEREVTGVLCAVNSADMLWNIIDAPVFNGEGFTNIIGSDGAFLLRSEHPEAVKKQADRIEEMGTFKEEELKRVYAALENGESGIASYITDGQWMMAAFQPVGVSDWFVFSAVPESAVKRVYNKTAAGVVSIVTGACLIFLFLLRRENRIVKKNQENLTRLAYEDSLLGCRNYIKFLKDAEMLLERQRERSFAVWYCDIKRFKYFNDLFGYHTGDNVLKAFAGYFQQDVREDQFFCRISGDHFAGISPYRDRGELQAWFDALIALLEDARPDTGLSIYLEFCMGCYCIEDDGITINEMVNRASMAENSVKESRGSSFAYFTDELRSRMRREQELEAMQKQALENGEFQGYMQPKIDIQNGNTLAGVEVLARWANPKLGMISPGEFVPLFEKNGFIVQLDRYIFERTCRWLSKRRGEGKPLVKAAVNVSRLGLLQEDFVSYYSGLKERYGIADGLLEIEFTESLLFGNNDVFNERVAQLQAGGFLCSLDDFGSGYSSLNVLKDLPIDVLKLDILFFRQSEDQERARIIIANIINMARELQIRTIAEGVEAEDQVEFLRNIGCDIVQGYVFAMPVPVAEMEASMDRQFGAHA